MGVGSFHLSSHSPGDHPALGSGRARTLFHSWAPLEVQPLGNLAVGTLTSKSCFASSVPACEFGPLISMGQASTTLLIESTSQE